MGGGGGGGGRVLLCAQRLYYRRDPLDCPQPNGLNHYLSLNKTGSHSKGERFRATMALLFSFWGVLNVDIFFCKILRGCFVCVICNSNSFHSLIFQLCIMIIHILNMCTSYYFKLCIMAVHILKICTSHFVHI